VADVKWIKITTDIFDDEKVLMIESMPSADSILVIWLKLLTFAGKQNNDGVFLMSNRIAYTDEMLASIFRRDLNLIRVALNTFQQFGMIEIIDNVITIPNWGKHQTLDAYEKKKVRDRERIARKRAEQKALIALSPDMSPDKSPVVAFSEREEEKDKDREEEKKSVRETTPKLFERISVDYVISNPGYEELANKVKEWLVYKMERRETYKEQGMRSLLRQIENNCFHYSQQAVCELIDESMANGWKGIIFDRLKKQTAQKGYQRQTKADELNEFYNIASQFGEGG
jgi:predicted phage replisome organizer